MEHRLLVWSRRVAAEQSSAARHSREPARERPLLDGLVVDGEQDVVPADVRSEHEPDGASGVGAVDPVEIGAGEPGEANDRAVDPAVRGVLAPVEGLPAEFESHVATPVSRRGLAGSPERR